MPIKQGCGEAKTRSFVPKTWNDGRHISDQLLSLSWALGSVQGGDCPLAGAQVSLGSCRPGKPGVPSS